MITNLKTILLSGILFASAAVAQRPSPSMEELVKNNAVKFIKKNYALDTTACMDFINSFTILIIYLDRHIRKLQDQEFMNNFEVKAEEESVPDYPER